MVVLFWILFNFYVNLSVQLSVNAFCLVFLIFNPESQSQAFYSEKRLCILFNFCIMHWLQWILFTIKASHSLQFRGNTFRSISRKCILFYPLQLLCKALYSTQTKWSLLTFSETLSTQLRRNAFISSEAEPSIQILWIASCSKCSAPCWTSIQYLLNL